MLWKKNSIFFFHIFCFLDLFFYLFLLLNLFIYLFRSHWYSRKYLKEDCKTFSVFLPSNHTNYIQAIDDNLDKLFREEISSLTQLYEPIQDHEPGIFLRKIRVVLHRVYRSLCCLRKAMAPWHWVHREWRQCARYDRIQAREMTLSWEWLTCFDTYTFALLVILFCECWMVWFGALLMILWIRYETSFYYV
jgi:hypothetical protein